MKPRRFLSTEQAAEHLAFSSVKAFRSFLDRRRAAGFPVRCFHRGSRLLFTEADLDAALNVEERRAPLRKVG